jgi:subtilisin family serine protease
MDNTEVTYEGLPFNDPYLGAQWHYHNNGTETWEETGADINAYKAWEINTGSTDIVVSIVDGGIDIDHKDLAGALWVNINEKDGDEDILDALGYQIDRKHGLARPQSKVGKMRMSS